MIQVNTYSIVAYDPDEHAWGVAVASKFLAVGSVVSWAKAGAGAVATQSYAKMSFGPDGLALLSAGHSAQAVLDKLLAADDNPQQRQVGIVDAKGGSAAHTGAKCHAWAGHKLGAGFACQGNILTGGNTLDAMAETYSTVTGELADRLIAALLAGDTIGGDKRGKQSAALLVVRPEGGYGGDNDRYLDLRVDDDPDPVNRLQQLVDIHHLFFGTPNPDDQLPITSDLARELTAMMAAQGYYAGESSDQWDDKAKQAFWALVGNENLEERWSLDADTDSIDRVALDYLRGRFK